MQLKEANKKGAIILSIRLAERLIESGVPEGTILELYAANLIGIGRYDDAERILEQVQEKVSERGLPWVTRERHHFGRFFRSFGGF